MPEIATKSVPGPGPLESLRRLWAWSQDQIAPVSELTRQYGPVARLHAGPFDFYFISDPDLVQECLVSRHKEFKKDRFFVSFVKLILGNGILTSDGKAHLRQRRMLQPAFHKQKVRAYAEAMVNSSARQCEAWQDGARVNMVEEMMGLTLDIVAQTLFNSAVTDDAHKVQAAIDTILDRSDVFLIPFFPSLLNLPLPRNRRFHAAIAQLDEVLYRIIDEHRASGDQGDLLSMMLAARDEEDNTGMTEQQLRDEALTLFTAGHETTSIALTWTWYLLSQHPEIEARMHEELASVLGGRLPGPDDYPSLPYTARVFKESLRLYPPTIMVGREAREDTTLGPYTIPKKGVVIMTPYVTHRSDNQFEDAETFDPDRWLPERSAGLHKFAFFPFGGGQRQCIGEGFAWMEGVLVLATLAQHWQARVPADHQLELKPRLTMRPTGGLPMILTRRGAQAAP